MNKRCTTCEPMLVGFMWEADGQEYSREMLRKCKACRREMVSDLIWVESNLPICGYCLCQDLEIIQDSGGKLQCRACGSTNVFILQPKGDVNV